MKVLIMSDSHGLTKEIADIVNRHKNEVEFMFHCGDSELSAKSTELKSFQGVKGNCDFGSDLPNELLIDVNGISLYLTHGHLYNVKSTLMNLKYRALELNAKIACYGHSHIAGAELIDGILFINPGSIRLPVMRKQKTYVILEVVGNKANIMFYEVNGRMIEDMSEQFTLT
jgi:putative phosphoesterase